MSSGSTSARKSRRRFQKSIHCSLVLPDLVVERLEQVEVRPLAALEDRDDRAVLPEELEDPTSFSSQNARSASRVGRQIADVLRRRERRAAAREERLDDLLERLFLALEVEVERPLRQPGARA